MSRYVISLAACYMFPFMVTTVSAQQNYFHRLQGMEDSTGVTHLTYQHTETDTVFCGYEDYQRTLNLTYTDLMHFNTETASDSALTDDKTRILMDCSVSGIDIYDVAAINNDPAQYVVAGEYGDGFEPYGYLNFTYSGVEAVVLFSIFDKIYINQGRADTLFLNAYHMTLGIPVDIDQEGMDLFSNYWDRDLDTVKTQFSLIEDFNVRAISPFKDEVIFGVSHASSDLLKSNDRGRTFEVSDSSTRGGFKFLFDPDSTHIYRYGNQGRLVRSDSLGEEGSWETIGSSDSRFYEFIADPDHSGVIYAYPTRDGYTLEYSDDYGSSFTEKLTLDDPITGFYKKPGSDLLYVLTQKELLRVENDQITSLRQIPVSIQEVYDKPDQYLLHQNYPNPFNPTTTIEFVLPLEEEVSLEVFNLLGQQVASLVNGKKTSGRHQVTFNANGLTSGMYFYRLQAGDFVETKTLLLIK